MTIPSFHDFKNPETRPLLEKYLAGKAGYSAEDRVKALRLVRDWGSVHDLVVTIHGEGSLAAQRISVFALGELERYKAAARRVARIKVEKEHPLYANLPQYPNKEFWKKWNQQ